MGSAHGITYNGGRHITHSPRSGRQPRTITMETLLSLAFDNLSSYDGPKVRKGLRQVEGLLAQICLSNPLSSSSSSSSLVSSDTNSPTKRSSQYGRGGAQSTMVLGGGGAPAPADTTTARKDLAQLSRDPAFREFFKLQEGFEWNVAMRLIGTLDRLMAKGSDGQNDLLILSALDLIQGVLLLHPPSKSLFSREQNMNVCTQFSLPVSSLLLQS